MRRAMVLSLAAIAMGMIAGCSGDIGGAPNAPQTETPNPDPTAVSALTLDEHTDTGIAGRMHTADGDLTFSATNISANRATVVITINGRTFDASLDEDKIVIDGHQTVLTVADTDLLQSFGDALALKLGDNYYQHDTYLYRFATHLATAPVGFVHVRLEVPTTPEVAAFSAAPADAGTDACTDAGPVDAGPPPVYGNEGKTCIKVGTSVNASYTSKAGNVTTYTAEPVVVGSNWGKIVSRDGKTGDYGCMGKCGAACSGLGGGYTKDCLDHDTCSFRWKAAGGASDPNCGDEYNAASDDIFNSCPTK